MDSSAGTSPRQQKIAIFGHVDVEPDARDGLIASVAELQRSTREDEPGCLVYVIAADPADPGRIQIAELWESAEALEKHFRHPNFASTGAALRNVTRLGGSSRKFRVDAEDEVRDAAGQASATFWSAAG
jgi:quinol monooxygenase YgiN